MRNDDHEHGHDLALLERWRDGAEPLSGAALDAVLHRVLDEGTAEVTPGVAVLTPRPRRRRHALVAAAAAVVAAALVVPAAAGDLWPNEQASASAAELLNQAADELIETSDVAVGPGQWLHLKLEQGPPDATEPSAVAFGTMQRTERWVPYDQSGDWYMLRHDHGAPTPAIVAERGQFYAQAPPVGSWMNPTPEFYASVPRETAALRARLPRRDRMAFLKIADVLQEGLMPADLRAAMYRVLATIDGVTLLDDEVANLAGQEGVAFSYREVGAEAYYEQVIIDPDTGRYIGERTVWEDDGAVSWIGAMSYEVVDEVPAEVLDQAQRTAWGPCQDATCMPER